MELKDDESSSISVVDVSRLQLWKWHLLQNLLRLWHFGGCELCPRAAAVTAVPGAAIGIALTTDK